MKVANKVCVVTGGASGIGKALCERFAQDGATVVVVDRNRAGASAVAEAIGGQAVPCDLAEREQVTEMIRATIAVHGRIDVLCNNAGIANDEDFLTGSLDPWQQQWDVNVMSHVWAVRAALPSMLERGEGYLLHTASMAGLLTSPGAAAYAASKHATVGLAEWLAATYTHRGIKVFLLAPLGVDTPLHAATPAVLRGNSGPVRTAAEVAQLVTDAFEAEQFLILTDPLAAEWMRRKADDLDRWLVGMQRMQQHFDAQIAGEG